MGVETGFLILIGMITAMLVAKQFATPMPVSDDKFRVMTERVSLLESKVESLTNALSNKNALLAQYIAVYGGLDNSIPKDSIKDLIEQDRLIDALMEISKTKEEEIKASCLLISSELKRLTVSYSKGSIDIETHNKERRKIAARVLSLIE